MRLLTILLLTAASLRAQTIPSILWGRWTIKRILPTQSISCWDDKQARTLIGTEIEYSADLFRWKDTITKNPVAESQTITAQQFHDENSGQGTLSSQVTFAQIGIKEPQAVQITMEHKPANVVSGSEIPGDRVVVKNANTIILSACGVFFEATRIKKTK